MIRALFTLSLLFCSLVIGSAPINQEQVEYLKPKLNSDRIEYFFGSYGVEKVEIDCPAFFGSRVANLHSFHEGKKVMRTLAVVDYCQPIHPTLQNVHSEIVNGKSIGIALREHGFSIQKKPVYFGEITLSQEVKEWMDESELSVAALHIYRLEASSIPYCTIVEIHSPQYLSSEWLQALYSDQYSQYSEVNEEINDLLLRLSVLMEAFPIYSKAP